SLGKSWVARFDCQEKSVIGHTTEAFPVEHGMIPARQAIHPLPRKKCGERGEKYRELEHDGEKCGNGKKVRRFAVHIDGGKKRWKTKFNERSREQSRNPAKQDPARQP